MSKVLLMGDWHLSDRPPSSCTEDYLEDLFDLGDQALEVAKERGVSAIVQAGDWFHVKMPSRNSHKLVIRSIEWAKQAPCPVFVVPGNHDMSNDRLESLNEGQPLGAVIRSEAVEMLQGWPKDRDPLELRIYGVPWLQDWDASPDVAEMAVKKALADYRDTAEDSVPFLVVTHAPFYPPGKEPTYENAEFFPPKKFALHMDGHGSVYYGHIHDPHGAYVEGGVRFANYGALSRGSLTESHLTRDVGVTLWDSVSGDFEFVKLAYRPASEVFRIKEVGEIKTAQAELNSFLAAIGQTTVEITSIEAVMNQIKAMNLGKDVEKIIEELLESAQKD